MQFKIQWRRAGTVSALPVIWPEAATNFESGLLLDMPGEEG
jgi:hypothetical protein